jgi:hypothetical protein
MDCVCLRSKESHLVEVLTKPALYCPIPSAINPDVEAIQCHSLAWVREFHLIQGDTATARFAASKFGWLAARAYPHAGFAEATIVVDWNVWLFMLDDQCDEGGIGKDPAGLRDYFTTLQAILRDPDSTLCAGPLENALRDVWQRMQARSAPTWQARFLRDAEEYFAACVWEAENRARGIVPTVADYIHYRPLTGALITDVDLIDLTEHLAWPDEARQHPLVQDLTAMANNVVCWSNDIISLEKEMRRGDVHNLVLTIRHRDDCTLQQAIMRATAMHDAEVRRFLDVETHLPTFASPAIAADVQCYVAVLRAWMRGNLDWGMDSGRYRPPSPLSSRSPHDA